ncbi:MAG TPA: response regulator [Alphaproteobacteria bacterium]|nr:response regulator [Alphaproteobacteria bacterium]
MTDLAHEIARHLPFLRRYARALTGSQERGDRYVRICLETLIEEPGRITADEDPRLLLYSIFHDVWAVVQSVAPEEAVAAGEPDAPAADLLQQGLAALPAIERQVLLLISLEGFSYEETGRILGLDRDEVRTLLHTAQEEIERQTATSVLIIEDEQLIAMDLARIVEEMGHRLCGTASRQQEAIDLAERSRPGLVLADIQLQNGDSGIQAVREILRRIDAPVIFVTGFPERLLTGEELEPAFVITKPFDPQILKTAIAQALSLSRGPTRPR